MRCDEDPCQTDGYTTDGTGGFCEAGGEDLELWGGGWDGVLRRTRWSRMEGMGGVVT
jgi:hypothetical protein